MTDVDQPADRTDALAPPGTTAPVEVVRLAPADVDDALLAGLGALVRQLSRSAPEPTRAEVEAMTASSATQVLVARTADGALLGTLTLVVFRIPTGVRAWVEDVVVDEAARGRGVAQALVVDALERARRAGARTVDLTSRPSREAANRLYRRVGFELRETNVYRFTHEAGPAGA
ncbi:GNAT family N-acetyltransferase [Actinotalea solisilvae]|uniref:GNAT family N-acetyltransferase n=1 Tax=Actinotalea solisilvae TaxID=2072922 RepID=UPI0018F21CBF|nr:GNAT family N-acetyltransferase [Actinotalea solisilvae]